jgi:hypothetical protein
MNWRQRKEGLVVNYSYLWAREVRLANDEGSEERPVRLPLHGILKKGGYASERCR